MTICIIAIFSLLQTSFAQPSLQESQRTNIRVMNAIKTKEDTLKKQFEKAGLQWPPKQLYLRSFKYDSHYSSKFALLEALLVDLL